MRRATTYSCAACAGALVFDDGEHTLCCENCGREFSLDMHPV